MISDSINESKGKDYLAEVYFGEPDYTFKVVDNISERTTKVPLRLASFIGFGMSIISLIAGFVYLIYKILYWSRFEAGLAPLVIGIFFFASVQLFFIGVVGEYIGAIYTQVRQRPLVIEKERINFE